MNWEQMLVEFAINTVDSFLAMAISGNATISKALLPILLKIYLNLQTVLLEAGAITGPQPSPAPAPTPAAPVAPATPAAPATA